MVSIVICKSPRYAAVIYAITDHNLVSNYMGGKCPSCAFMWVYEYGYHSLSAGKLWERSIVDDAKNCFTHLSTSTHYLLTDWLTVGEQISQLKFRLPIDSMWDNVEENLVVTNNASWWTDTRYLRWETDNTPTKFVTHMEWKQQSRRPHGETTIAFHIFWTKQQKLLSVSLPVSHFALVKKYLFTTPSFSEMPIWKF